MEVLSLATGTTAWSWASQAPYKQKPDYITAMNKLPQCIVSSLLLGIFPYAAAQCGDGTHLLKICTNMHETRLQYMPVYGTWFRQYSWVSQ